MIILIAIVRYSIAHGDANSDNNNDYTLFRVLIILLQ